MRSSDRKNGKIDNKPKVLSTKLNTSDRFVCFANNLLSRKKYFTGFGFTMIPNGAGIDCRITRKVISCVRAYHDLMKFHVKTMAYLDNFVQKNVECFYQIIY